MPTDWLDRGNDTVVLDYTDNIWPIRGKSSAVDRFMDMNIANQNAGDHWFEGSTMRFFNTRLHRGTIRQYEGEYFVTSERPDPGTPWLYTVRMFNWDTGKVSTIGEFRGHGSFDAAWDEIEELAS